MSTLAVDVGGTFTDFVHLDERGNLRHFKSLTDVRAPERTVIEGFRKVGGARDVLHASTIATNALRGQMRLERPRVGMLVTRGFRDAIEIGRQNRPRLYDLLFEKPRPFVPRELRAMLRDEWEEVPVYRRERLPRGFRAEGPALMDEYDSTTVVPDGWSFSVGPSSCIVLERS